MSRTSCFVLLCLFLLAGSADASVPNWEFQNTGFTTGQLAGTDDFATALTMRDGFAWPVIHAPDRFSGDVLRSYSLFPTVNPNTQTNWFELGAGALLGNTLGNAPRLRAVSNAQGEYAVTYREHDGNNNSVTLLGNSSSSGLETQLPGIGAFDFAPDGGSLTPNNTMPPGVLSEIIIDIAASKTGEVSVVTQSDRFNPEFTIWIDNPLIGWQSTSFNAFDNDPFAHLAPETIDLAYDSSPRPTPHVLGVDAQTGTLVAFDFDARTAQWNTQMLDQIPFTSPDASNVSLADNGAGVLGAAWVADGELKYAYRDSNVINPSWEVTTVHTLGQEFSGQGNQTVGLAFDFHGLPLISFVDEDQNTGDDVIYLAYDPPAIVTPNGDQNGDGFVNAADYAIIRDGLGGATTNDDLDAWRAGFNGASFGGPAPAASVPEPATVALLLGLAFTLPAPRQR